MLTSIFLVIMTKKYIIYYYAILARAKSGKLIKVINCLKNQSVSIDQLNLL